MTQPHFLMENSIYSSFVGEEVMENIASDAGNREHGALTGLMLKSLFAVGSYHAEGLDIGRIYADVRHYADGGNKRFSHLSHFSLLLTFSLP